MEDFKAVVDAGVLYFVLFSFGLSVASHLDTEVVATSLPVHLAIGNVKQILGSDLKNGSNKYENKEYLRTSLVI